MKHVINKGREGKPLEKISRRKFLVTSISAVGAFMLGSMLPRQPLSIIRAFASEADFTDIDKKPLPYTPLDPEEVKVRAYKYYWSRLEGSKVACAEGVFGAFVHELRKKIGGVWNYIPTFALWWQIGGGAGWATLCGALAGAATIISLVLGRSKLTKQVINELFRWYELYPFPQWTPPDDVVEEAGGVKGPLPTSIAFSVLCHPSVTRWCLVAKKASGSKERGERCARLTGEVAAKTAELLNAAVAGTFKPMTLTPLVVDEKYGCRSCHRKRAPYEQGGWTRGKMYCILCHRAPHLKLGTSR